MSQWYNITKQRDLEINNDDNTLEVYIGEDYGGAIYVSIPVEFIKELLDEGTHKELP
jgi:hypothetical protein